MEVHNMSKHHQLIARKGRRELGYIAYYCYTYHYECSGSKSYCSLV